MKITDSKPGRPRGRPVSFDRETVLERAMHVFWRQGYETTTIQDLTEAMEITAPSLYGAFGDKAGLYFEAVAYYRQRYGDDHAKCLLNTSPTAREAVRNLLFEAVHTMSDPETPAGCMVVNSAINCYAQSTKVQTALAEFRAEAEGDLRQRIERGIEEGDVPAGTNAAILAKFYTTVIMGMSLQARDGLDCAGLQAIIDSAMQAWPQA
ncbi:TetR family transcriptional regulator [Corticimicrobacter populi]|uniref:TetR family transcriptional regulator n=2 Tax=Alcaligenaceae TaxID=506 RepID=A0A2V1K3B0_9BURK|nr:TetR family transcriptional regulator [Corticimicrobacter populi]